MITEAFLEERIERIPESGCWIWTRSTKSSGYGQFQMRALNSSPIDAHRASYELYIGYIPEGMCVLHRCDVRECINPHHLFLGTRTENMQDKVSKGRQSKGFQLPQTRLSTKDIEAIRKSGKRQIELAKEYVVDPSHISKIRSGDRCI